MHHIIRTLTILCTLSVVTLLNAHTSDALANSFVTGNLKSNVTRSLVSMPYFEKNQGQFDATLLFGSDFGFNFYGFMADGLYSKNKENNAELILRFKNSKPVIYQPSLPQTARINYYRGAQDSEWVNNVATYQRLLGKEIYSGIDIEYHFNDKRLEYDFVVQPGVSPKQIILSIDYADKLNINQDGDLEISSADVTVVHKAPIVYQLAANQQKEFISANYVINDKDITFAIGSYDRSRVLIIDPIIEVSGLLGGEWEDQANGVATDSLGNIYVVGSTASRARITYENLMSLVNTALPTQQDTTGTHYFDNTHGISPNSSFINNNVIDLNNGILLDANGDVLEEPYGYGCDYLYRGFFNADRLITNYDGYISKYNANFELIYTTYFGGCRNDGIRSVVIDANDNVYIGGITLSDDFPLRSSSQSRLAGSRLTSEPVLSDAFYAKFDPNGELIYSSYLGGNGRDGIRDIAVDANGNLYVTGFTHSTDLNTNCIVGAVPVVQCEHIGGIKTIEEVGGSPDISVYSDVFVARISPQGNTLSFLTYLGGQYDDWGQKIKLFNNSIYIAGNSSSADISTSGGSYSFSAYRDNDDVPCSRTPINDSGTSTNADLHRCEDGFVTKMSLDGTIINFSAYVGGALDDNIYDLDIDTEGNLYVVGTSRSAAVAFDLDNTPSFANAEDQLAYIDLLKQSFPVYKNINQFAIDSTTQINNAFLVILNPNATQLIQSSFIGGEADDAGLAVEVGQRLDGSNLVDVYVAGHTISEDFYRLKSFNSQVARNDVFIMKLVLDFNQKNRKYNLSAEPFLSDPNACFSTSNNGCGLYSISYSSLFGGEALEDLKDMLLNSDGLLLTGTTYSENFPIVGNALKNKIQLVENIEFDPFTRAEIDKFEVVPSDAFLLKINDADESIDLSIGVSNGGVTSIDENETIVYQITLTNLDVLNAADNVSLAITYPFLSNIENLPNHVSISAQIEDCVLEVTQLNCSLGTLAADTIHTIDFTIKTNNAGRLPVSFNISSTHADNALDNNIVKLSVDVNSTSGGGSIALFSLISFILFGFYRAMYRKLN